MFLRASILSVGLLALFSSARAQCCYDYQGNCVACQYTGQPDMGSSTEYPPGAYADALSNGNVPSGTVNLGNVAQAGHNQNGGFFSNAVTQNNATGEGAYIVSSASSSATNSNNMNMGTPVRNNTQMSNPNVIADSYAGSSGTATQGSVMNLDQASSTGNNTSVVGNGQSQIMGNGTGLDTYSGASASAVQRTAVKKTAQSQSKNASAKHAGARHAGAIVRSSNQRAQERKVVKGSNLHKPVVAAAPKRKNVVGVNSNSHNVKPAPRRAVHKTHEKQ
ncbi:hypothetical protein RvY_16228 [Ramazzottius varieornatus]|uniref:Uncharacterized protein n=1 Tax=Ramazzottius varieornatus TaxID=947166 RepID=A0A1D1W0N9_RAMVA|nr:hypothetical protein RvY_16228 [Ramazzottius varieornatus]